MTSSHVIHFEGAPSFGEAQDTVSDAAWCHYPRRTGSSRVRPSMTRVHCHQSPEDRSRAERCLRHQVVGCSPLILNAPVGIASFHNGDAPAVSRRRHPARKFDSRKGRIDQRKNSNGLNVGKQGDRRRRAECGKRLQLLSLGRLATE
jgi:hypothetical protein